MSNVVIFGNNYFSELICDYIEEFTEDSVVAFMVNGMYINNSLMRNKKVLPFEELERFFDMADVKILVTTGYRGMNELRKNICTDIVNRGYKLYSFIHPKSIVYADAIGEGNIVLEGVIISKHVKMGNGNIIWNGVNISHHSEIGNYNFFAPSAVIGGRCNIANNCFFGLNSTVRGG